MHRSPRLPGRRGLQLTDLQHPVHAPLPSAAASVPAVEHPCGAGSPLRPWRASVRRRRSRGHFRARKLEIWRPPRRLPLAGDSAGRVSRAKRGKNRSLAATERRCGLVPMTSSRRWACRRQRNRVVDKVYVVTEDRQGLSTSVRQHESPTPRQRGGAPGACQVSVPTEGLGTLSTLSAIGVCMSSCRPPYSRAGRRRTWQGIEASRRSRAHRRAAPERTVTGPTPVVLAHAAIAGNAKFGKGRPCGAYRLHRFNTSASRNRSTCAQCCSSDWRTLPSGRACQSGCAWLAHRARPSAYSNAQPVETWRTR